MTDKKLTLRISVVHSDDMDQEELEETTHRLRAEILESGVDSVNFLHEGSPPHGSRTNDPVTLGTLIVTLSASGGVITSLIGAVRCYLSRNEKHSIIVENEKGAKITVTGHSTDEERGIVQEWLTKDTE